MKPGLRKLLNFLFIAGTMALVLVIAFGNSDLENAWEALFTLNPYWLAASAGCWFAYLLFDALGYHYFLRKQNYGIHFRTTLFISLMGFYYGNVTPGASGGQPMQIYYMNKHGVPIGIGTSGISMKFICNQLMVVLLASVLWILNIDFVNLQLASVRWLVVVGWCVNFAAIPLILLIAFHRPLVQRVAGFLVRAGHKLRLIKQPDVTMLHIHTTLDTYHASFLRLTRHPKQVLIQLGLSALSVMGLMSVILCVYRAFGESGTPWFHLLTISFLLFLSASYTPLPGASGAQEGGFLIFYRGLFTTGTIGLALLVWRFMTYYLFLIVGMAATVLSHLRPSKKNTARPVG